jgi:hypothetical protein
VKEKKVDLKSEEARKSEKQEFSTNPTGSSHKTENLLTGLCAADHFWDENSMSSVFRKNYFTENYSEKAKKRLND